MPDPDPRFEVPPEYADVYEEAFRRVSRGEADEGEEATAGGRTWSRRLRSRIRAWWDWRSVALVLALVAVALGAYVLGRSERPIRSAPAAGKASYSSVTPVRPVLAASTCRPPTVSDANGRSVSFVPSNAIDAASATSWACSGAAVGDEIVLTLPRSSTVSRVGLLPGTMLSGVALNRIDAVDWIFGDGRTVHQDLDPGNVPIAQILDVPADRSRTVRLRLTAVTPGPADLTAVSSVYLWGP